MAGALNHMEKPLEVAVDCLKKHLRKNLLLIPHVIQARARKIPHIGGYVEIALRLAFENKWAKKIIDLS